MEQPQWYGDTDNRHDPHLSAQGIVQARVLARRLKNEPIAHIIASPYLRALETAHYIAEALHLPLSVEPGIGEWLNPAWMDADPQIAQPHERAARFAEIDPHYVPALAPIYPETWEQMQRRAATAIQGILARLDGNIVVVGHGHVIAATIAALTGAAETTLNIGLCSVTRLDCDGEAWQLERCGDISHLLRFARQASA